MKNTSYLIISLPTSHPDIVVQDICEIIGFDSKESPHQRKYFRKLLPEGEAEVINTLGICTELGVDKPWQSRASDCVYLRDTRDASGSRNISARLAVAAVSLASLFIGMI